MYARAAHTRRTSSLRAVLRRLDETSDSRMIRYKIILIGLKDNTNDQK